MSDKLYNKIAIIPAKKDSIRIPNKNIKEIDGKMLFVYSVEFAIENDFIPVVSTDSELIIGYCMNNNILYYSETVDDTKMENCVNQVLNKYNPEYFALLQPTSPLRKENQLSIMFDELDESSFTAQKIKIIGMYKNEFLRAWREQDCDNFLYHFDGNIILCKTSFYFKNNYFLDNNSKIYINEFPYYLQIDNVNEFNVIKKIIEDKIL